MRTLPLVVLAIALVGGSTACASKKFVRTSVGSTNERVKTLVAGLEEAQMRNGRNERRIAEVDAKTASAARAAEAAHGVARGAARDANDAGDRLASIERASKKITYDVELSADEANFAFGHAELPQGAKVRIDGIIHELMDDPKAVFIEIEGHTDDRGPHDINFKLGLARAQAVQKYLYDVHQIPLHKMNVISFGEVKPATSNKTEAGRSQNRRIVIRIRA